MRTPEEALAAARRQAQARRLAEPELGRAPSDQDLLLEAREASLKQLTRWAMIEPEELEVYSTRRLGAPITALKRLLIRLLRQYLVQMSAQQSRFNAYVVGYLVAMDERIRALEEARDGGAGPEPETVEELPHP
ncbi:MAG TPA: hypothetical protein VE983_03745 [Solirubrobacteraceae bacterium]|nr:hypothetical protein [Solirubrobacteraceae bacterium]